MRPIWGSLSRNLALSSQRIPGEGSCELPAVSDSLFPRSLLHFNTRLFILLICCYQGVFFPLDYKKVCLVCLFKWKWVVRKLREDLSWLCLVFIVLMKPQK